MDFKNYIDTNINYLENLKEKEFIVKKKKNLHLVKYPYLRNVFDETWQRYCRGCIIDSTNNKILCIPPIKAILYDESMNFKQNYKCQPLIDGTMVNMFFYDEKWIISSRSEIGGNNKWNHKSIFNMVKDCCDYNKLCNCLDKTCCYSFVMNHKSIRNISNIVTNKLTLVEQYNLDTLIHVETFTDVPCDTIQYIPVLNRTVTDIINEFIDSSKNDFNKKGITFKWENKRINILNKKYVEVKKTFGVNTDNILYKFVDIKKNGKLNEYIDLYPEHNDKFTLYSYLYDTLCNDLLSTYHELFIHKTMIKTEVKYQLNPLIYMIHKHYLDKNEYINKKYIDNFVKQLDIQRLVFTLKYYI